jgi:O-antigen/teichoic acid export membrane protein
VPVLVIALLLTSLTGFLRFGLLVGERTHSITVISYLTAAAITILNLGLIPSFGMMGAALALAGARLIQFVVTFMLSKRKFDMGIAMKPVVGLLCLLLGAALVADLVPRDPSIVRDCVRRGTMLLVALVPVALVFWRTPFAKAQIAPVLSRVRSRIRG